MVHNNDNNRKLNKFHSIDCKIINQKKQQQQQYDLLNRKIT